MKIMIVVGARPNFMKAAPLVFAIRAHNNQVEVTDKIACVLVHTGQHYDEAMSAAFFSDLSLPQPDIRMGVGSASHAVQTAEIMRRFEGILLQEKPDVVVVVGDVNSTVACALVASKISLDSKGSRPLIAHVEAGLRSFDSAMPEEINRILTDHLSDLLFVTEESGLQNLNREGIDPDKIRLVGNTMIDSLIASAEKAEGSHILEQLGLRRGANGGTSILRYGLLTLHRPSNVDDRETFRSILDGLVELSDSCPILFSVHPRTRKRIAEFGLEHYFEQLDSDTERAKNTRGIHLLQPLGYLDFLCLMKHAVVVVTDSGGIQEETTCLRVPCVTVRENTERPVTVTHGTNTIAGTATAGIRDAIREQLNGPKDSVIPEKWDGRAAERIVQAIAGEFAKRKSGLSWQSPATAEGWRNNESGKALEASIHANKN